MSTLIHRLSPKPSLNHLTASRIRPEQPYSFRVDFLGGISMTQSVADSISTLIGGMRYTKILRCRSWRFSFSPSIISMSRWPRWITKRQVGGLSDSVHSWSPGDRGVASEGSIAWFPWRREPISFSWGLTVCQLVQSLVNGEKGNILVRGVSHVGHGRSFVDLVRIEFLESLLFLSISSFGLKDVISSLQNRRFESQLLDRWRGGIYH